MAKKASKKTARRVEEEPPGDPAPPAASMAERISQGLLENVPKVAADCGASAIFVYADALRGGILDLPRSTPQRIVYVTKTTGEEREQEERGGSFLRVPNVPLARMSQVKIAMFLALSRGLIQSGDVVLFLSGLTGSGTLDTLVVLEAGAEMELVEAPQDEEGTLPDDLQPEVLERVVDLATELGSEGREGKPVGAFFVVGDHERVRSLTRQLILNPFRGYDEAERNVLDPRLEETVKELSSLDGAFVLRGDGVIETCGAFIKTAAQEEFDLPRGLGSRHHAAAAITAVTGAIAVTVSESTGTVTIFRGGRIVTEVEKPRGTGRGFRMSGAFLRPGARKNPE